MKELKNHIKEVEEKIGYKFINADLLTQAFTRRTYSQEKGGENNETLEFIGDKVLDFYVIKVLMDKYGYTKSELEGYYEKEPDQFAVKRFTNEGSLTEVKKNLVNKQMLSSRIDNLELKDYLIMGNGDILQHKENETSVKEDLFEAILGAIAKDSNWNSTSLEKSVTLMLDIEYYLNNGFKDDKDFVSLVQQWNQKRNGEIPEYIFKEQSNGVYEAHLVLNIAKTLKDFKGFGNSKAEARNEVASNAFYYLQRNSELFTFSDDLPEDITLENAINTLQELAQKGYISLPEYKIIESKGEKANEADKWLCKCRIESLNKELGVYDFSKKMAKKKVAHLWLTYLFDLYNVNIK